jgi:CRP/FNR family cyclic AMP-dependent transcriptional regulator
LPNAVPQEPRRRSFLELLDLNDRAEVEARGRARQFNSHQLIFRQGDPAGRLVIIKHGLVKVSLAIGRQPAMLAIRGSGDVIGEMAMIDGRSRSATVTALTPVSAVILEPPVDDLLTLPSISRALLMITVRRLREADRRRVRFGRANVTERVAYLLAGLAEHGYEQRGKVIIDFVSQEDLASAVGATRPTVNRSLSQLAKLDILTTEGQRISILDLEKLRRTGG